jgi:hypothetical protein
MTQAPIRLDKALRAWSTPAFAATLKQELEQLDTHRLPLQQGLSLSSWASDEHINAIILDVSEQPDRIRAKTGVFFTGIIPGCSCADDPTPMSDYTEYCELLIEIDKATAEATVTLLTD